MEFCIRCGFDMDSHLHEDDMQEICTVCWTAEYDAYQEARAEDMYMEAQHNAEMEAENAWLRHAEGGWDTTGEYLYDSVAVRF